MRANRRQVRAVDGAGEVNLKKDFPLLANDPGLHYLDSAATSQKPKAVLDAMREFYETSNANPHRGAYALSVRATECYEQARHRTARFLGVRDPDCLIFTRGTTESLNLVASAWGRANVSRGDEIVVTAMDHHANFVPWQQLAIEKGAKLRVCELTSDGRIDLDCLTGLLGPRTKVVAFNHVSNAIGTINPVTEIVRAVREKSGAITVCDGAQSAPHMPVSFEEMPPYQTGGDMIEFVGDERTTWNQLPHKFEAGTPNAANAVGLAAAADYLDGLGMDRVREHELGLMSFAQQRLEGIEGLQIFGPAAPQRSGVVSFTMTDVHPHDLATILDGEGVCIRAGHHCAQPLMRRLNVPATARASFYVYNDEKDVDALVAGILKAREIFGCVPA
jgi:cysteine desulfurase/selenocysteine lyase